ncbi:MAG: hypothetical protein HY525_17435 [Betaproteobacteria bacterium]|nr:hypothetical protein [Betaproteobacteria bacterium]
MAFKVFAGIVAVVLLLVFLLPYVLKMKDIALGVVIVAGLAMMGWDLWETFQEKDE